MNGRQLYEFYVEANAQNNCGVDEWYDMSTDDQDMWHVFAGLIAQDDPRIELTTICQRFVNEHEIRCVEDVYQRDSLQEHFPELVENICETIGYYDAEDSL